MGQDNNMHNERKKRSSDNSEGDADSGNEAEGDQGPPSKFVIPGDDTGIGIDYHILDQESWQTLQEYCQVLYSDLHEQARDGMSVYVFRVV